MRPFAQKTPPATEAEGTVLSMPCEIESEPGQSVAGLAAGRLCQLSR
jgi:hypothetical protein